MPVLAGSMVTVQPQERISSWKGAVRHTYLSFDIEVWCMDEMEITKHVTEQAGLLYVRVHDTPEQQLGNT